MVRESKGSRRVCRRCQGPGTKVQRQRTILPRPGGRMALVVSGTSHPSVPLTQPATRSHILHIVERRVRGEGSFLSNKSCWFQAGTATELEPRTCSDGSTSLGVSCASAPLSAEQHRQVIALSVKEGPICDPGRMKDEPPQPSNGSIHSQLGHKSIHPPAAHPH